MDSGLIRRLNKVWQDMGEEHPWQQNATLYMEWYELRVWFLDIDEMEIILIFDRSDV